MRGIQKNPQFLSSSNPQFHKKSGLPTAFLLVSVNI